MLKIIKKQYNYRQSIKKYELKVKALKAIFAITCDKELQMFARCLLIQMGRH